MAPPGSLTAGQRSPFCCRKARAVLDVSWNTTLTMSAPLVACACSNWNLERSGASCWQGIHQLAKKLTTTGRPRSEASETGAPVVRSVPLNAGAGRPTSGLDTAVASRRRRGPAPGGPHQPADGDRPPREVGEGLVPRRRPEPADRGERQVDVIEETRVDGRRSHDRQRTAEAGRRRGEHAVVHLDDGFL